MWCKYISIFVGVLFFCIGYFANFTVLINEHYMIHKAEWTCVEKDPLSRVTSDNKNCKLFKRNIL